jgi:hypothetical protein
MKKRISILVGLLILMTSSGAFANTTDSTTYGSGNYGNCDYGSCTITLSSSGSVTANVTPSAGGACTVQSDAVTVTTDSTTGYTLTATTSSTSTGMTSGGNTIPSTTATQASPSVLTSERWGFRVDGLGGFGSGPTTAQTNGSIPSLTFAGMPSSSGTPDQLASTSSPASSGATTNVWYGVCADTGIPSGTYSVSVLYTAVTN